MRRWVLFGLVFGLVPPSAIEDDNPNGPVRIVVPFAAGSGIDTCARLLASRLEAAVGRSFAVENRVAARANPDG